MSPGGLRIDGPDAPGIAGLRFRQFRDDRDYEALAELMTAANLADGVDYIPDAPSLRVEYENADDLDVRRDLVFAEIDGRVVGYGEARRQVRDGAPVYVSFGAVRPEFRRRGLGRALLRWNQDRSRGVALLHPDEGVPEFRAWIADRQGGARELLEGDGYIAVRHGFEMTRGDLGELPDAPLPDGIVIRPVVREQLRTIFDAENEAFRDHWGHHEMGDAASARPPNRPTSTSRYGGLRGTATRSRASWKRSSSDLRTRRSASSAAGWIGSPFAARGVAAVSLGRSSCLHSPGSATPK
jgi:GNAT superfamily N-acetyltransferase